MDIYTVRDNLKRTIAGKEKALEKYRNDIIAAPLADQPDSNAISALYATIQFLKINIDELRAILKDVEVCCKQASDESWITNPDRMGGGGWTAEELDPNRGWK